MITQRPTIGSFLSSGMVASSSESTLSPLCAWCKSSSDLPHDTFEIGGRHGELENPLAGGPIEAGVAAQELDVEPDRIAGLEPEPSEGDGEFEDPGRGDLHGVPVTRRQAPMIDIGR